MTHADVVDPDLYAKVSRLVRSKFPPDAISDIRIEDVCDENGQRILLITAVFEGPTEQFIQQKPPGLMRFLRDALLGSNEKAFPLLSFVSANEAYA